ncbi:MAG: nuclear transport factor 2 family protein [Pseudomonadota bacterium]|nr:nuclear transport factor 2 family protein [Pseudomonadota bacterium]
MNGLERWHHVMKEGDMETLYDLLHPDCVFISPVVHTPQKGREITYAYLRAANKALSEDFQYVREVVQDNYAVLEFTVKVDGIFVNGVDIITFEGDQIVEFKVMVRPLKAVNAVWKQMGKMLEQLKAAS